MILENEAKIHEVTINAETFTVTDKRVINTTLKENAFIGFSELRGAELARKFIKIDRFTLPEIGNFLPAIALVSIILSYIYVCTSDTTFEFGDLAPLFVAIIYSFGVAPILLIIIYSIKAITSFKKEVVTFSIIKKDGIYWINQHYDLSFENVLSNLVNEINKTLYQ